MIWSRVELVLRKHFQATQNEINYGWDINDLQDAMSLTSGPEIDWCYGEKWRGQNVDWLTKHKIGTVKRGR